MSCFSGCCAGTWLAFGLTPAAWAFYPLMFALTLLLSYAAAQLFARLPYGEYLTGAPANLRAGGYRLRARTRRRDRHKRGLRQDLETAAR